ncbi:JAB domain-containing protein [bacterium]|nr:JAB domain-containing protein [bacterium]
MSVSENSIDVSKMDSREILSNCFGVLPESMRGDSLNEVFSSLKINGSKHIVEGLLILFDRYTEEKTKLKGLSFTRSADIFDHLKLYFSMKQQEEFHVLLLDNKHRLIEDSLMITKGTLNQTLYHPREIFAPAIEKRAASIILVHNHPSGDPTPSNTDIQTTQRLVNVGATVGISVLDHIVFGSNKYFSFIDEELLPQPTI